MDLDEFQQIKEKYVSHWAEKLEAGDRCMATLRHSTDGSKNIHNADIIVVGNDVQRKSISGQYLGQNFEIPYNELTQIPL